MRTFHRNGLAAAILAAFAGSWATPVVAQSALTSPEVIREVQGQLYNLNYAISLTDGRLNPETREAIRKWQENTKRTATGDLTAADLAFLRSARIPVVWGALAWNVRGASGVVWNRPSRSVAEQAALEQCRKNSKGSSCKSLAAANKACGALGFYTGRVRGTQHWGAYARIKPNLGLAVQDALDACRQAAKTPNACGVRITFCADGSHKG